VGHRVALADRNAEVLAVEAGRLHGTYPDAVTAFGVDVTDDVSVGALVDAVAAWAGGVDALINCAGIIARSASEELATQTWQQVLDVNVGGSFRCARAAFPHLRRSSYPSVVNIGSIGSFLGMPMRLAYNTSKSGVLGLTRTLAAEWGEHGIRVNAIAPGFIDTAMMRSGLEAGVLDEDLMLRRIPMRRLGRVDEISAVAAFLASPAASYINGAVIAVDGGTTIDGTFF
jgi:3-oxoacyl-[acyl-carrier protein] reductase